MGLEPSAPGNWVRVGKSRQVLKYLLVRLSPSPGLLAPGLSKACGLVAPWCVIRVDWPSFVFIGMIRNSLPWNARWEISLPSDGADSPKISQSLFQSIPTGALTVSGRCHSEKIAAYPWK